MTRETLLLTRSDVAALLTLDECIEAVERAFRLHAEGRSLPPGTLSVPVEGGGFHIKAAGLKLERSYFAVKTNGNFFQNRERFGMPNIQGFMALCDADNGFPLALMDSIEITIQRTGAATAVAARRLARADAKTATICGCGNQGRVQLRALARVRPIERAFACDSDLAQAENFAREMAAELGIEIRVVFDLTAALRQSDVCITCTPSRKAFVKRVDVQPGMFIAAVGADSPEKQELEPALVASAKVVVDLPGQCAAFGELHHALEAGLMRREDVHAELAEVVSGARPGRESGSEVIIFDSTGTALQDAAAAIVVFEKALAAGHGRSINLQR